MKKEFLIPEVEALRFITAEAVTTGNPLTGGGAQGGNEPSPLNLSDTIIDGDMDGGEGNLN